MATVFVENKPYEMNAEENLLHGCLSLGFNLPYFCWHPALGSVGACRQCAVKQFKDEHDTKGKIVMACVTAASEGTRISIDDPEAAHFRKMVIEGLMLNHPHDCPVCDEGGECHLQDMTVMTGHDYRRYRFQKRVFRNQNLGPLVNHEMNRCIQCYRCVRYYRDYAGGTDLNEFVIRDIVFFGRNQDGVLENEFSGNLVEVCPTGVFTDKTLKRHYTRKWDQLFAPSICVHCGAGCNTNVGERYGLVRRVLNRYNHDVNGYFLCDRGRFGYEFVNSGERIRDPLLDGRPVPGDFAMLHLRDVLSRGRAIGIASPRASIESNFALWKLVGAEHFYSGIADHELRLVQKMIAIQSRPGIRTASLYEIEQADGVFVLGEDLTNVSPRAALSVRQAARQQPLEIARSLKIPVWQDKGVRDATQNRNGPVFIAAPYATRLDDIATETLHAAPDDLARLGFAVAHALDAAAPAWGDIPLANRIAAALKTCKRPVVIAGPSCGSEAIIEAAANVAMAANATLHYTAPECNTIGAAMLGGGPLSAALEAMHNRETDTVVILENDLFRRSLDAEAALASVAHVIVLDSLHTRTTAKAELVLAAATFAESDGTFVNSEGRAQRFFQIFVPRDEVRESWRWLGNWAKLDDLIGAVAQAFPALSRIREAAPPSTFRMANAKIPRAPHRFSGRTAILANIDVSEPKPPSDPDSALSFSMEGAQPQPPAALIPFFWSPGWNSIQATNFYQREVGGPLKGGVPGVRLYGTQTGAPSSFFSSIPNGFIPRHGEFFFVPIYHIFGSEELSVRAPGIAELQTGPYIALSDEKLANGPDVDVSIQGHTFRLPVRIRRDLPDGVAGIPLGVPPLTGLTLPAWGTIANSL